MGWVAGRGGYGVSVLTSGNWTREGGANGRRGSVPHGGRHETMITHHRS